MKWKSAVRMVVLVATCVFAQESGLASTISTQLELEARALAGALGGYAQSRGGELPDSWEELKSGINFDQIEMRVGKLIENRTLLLPKNSLVALSDSSGARLLAMTAFPINEDRRNGNGRYVVYQQDDGKFAARWEGEQTIQKALATANVSVPPAAVYQERLLKPLNLEYGMKLVEDAVQHGVPMEQAVKVVEKHVDDVSNRRAKAATTWAQIASGVTRASTTPEPSMRDQWPTPDTSPLPSTPGAKTAAGPSERRAPVWPWVAGILALVVIGGLAWRRHT